MRERGLDGLLVHGNRAERAPIRYLSNFEDYYSGDTLIVIPLAGAVGLTTNAVMHGEPMHSGIQDTWIRDVRCAPHPRTVDYQTTTIYDHLEDFLTEHGLAQGALGISGEYAYHAREFLGRRFPGLRQLEAAALVGEAMMRKSDAEVTLMKEVALMSDAGVVALMNAVKPGVSEHDLAAEANYALFKAGAEDTAFPIAACGGPRTGFKHVVPSARRLQAGDRGHHPHPPELRARQSRRPRAEHDVRLRADVRPEGLRHGVRRGSVRRHRRRLPAVVRGAGEVVGVAGGG